MDFTKLTVYLDSLEDKYGIPACDCIIYHRHENVYRHMAGFADYARTVPVSESNLYHVYSATKVITCTAVMQLVEAGRLRLEDLLENWLPEFAHVQVAQNYDMEAFPPASAGPDTPTVPVKQKIRIIDLMTMTAGLTYDIQSAAIQEAVRASGGAATTREMMAAIARMPLAYQPGSRWRYSLAHDVLAAVVEVVSGEFFGDYLARHIFEPLGLRNMMLKLDADREKQVCAQYTADFATGKFEPAPEGIAFALTDKYQSGGAGLICTVGDYGLFVDAMCNGGVGKNGNRIIGPEMIEEMRKNRLQGQPLADFKKSKKVGYGYGLGVRTLIDPAASRGPVGEFGWDGAAGAYVVIDPDNHLGLFYAQHVLQFPRVYTEVHPVIRDLAYEGLGL